MRYFLKNIAQDSMPRTILLIVLGVAMWVPSFTTQEYLIPKIVTLLLTIINALLITHCFYRGRETNLPSHFVGSTYWLAMSAIPALHTCWQAQFVIMGMLLAILTLLRTDYHHEATEEAFLSTLICCFFAPLQSTIMTGIIMIWGYLIFKGLMTWRVWFASLIAIAIRVVLMLGLHYLGWLEWLWLENIPHLSVWQWLIFGGVFLVTALLLLLPLRRPSTATGIIYLTLTILLTATGILWHKGLFFN
ncbi:MAG: hypothetical protein J6C57_04820 [Paludibacteraceae bacterium]|nr:hypothetical protein [Paludibacteraceae bacterium]MBP3575064.1 hypothetical protein [Paludibacteraceae bacterium]